MVVLAFSPKDVVVVVVDDDDENAGGPTVVRFVRKEKLNYKRRARIPCYVVCLDAMGTDYSPAIVVVAVVAVVVVVAAAVVVVVVATVVAFVIASLPFPVLSLASIELTPMV